MRSINPYNNEVLQSYDTHRESQVLSMIEKADDTYQKWQETTFEHRSALMKQCASVLREGKEKYGRLMTLEMGKVWKEAVAEVEKCALVCDYYAVHAERFLADEKLDVPEGEALISYHPLGIVLAIMPWNFPFWQVFRFASPNLMAGNVGLLKHASNVPQCALAIEEIFRQAGFPDGVFQALLIESDKVEKVIDDPRIKAVTITGSERAGSKVAESAGRNIKKTVLELGGSDPFIVLEDADLEVASDMAVKSRMVNFGQSCIAAKRFIVVVTVAEEFLEKFKRKMEALTFGDPFDEATDYSVLAREDLAEELLRQVRESVSQGAHVILGGDRPDKKGAFFNPTILTNVRPGMPACDEELFGPVATVIVVEGEEEAIKIANKSRFGLGGSVWTTNIEKGKAVAKKVQSGAVYVNKMMASHPNLPFGGVKKSGYGRELSHLGIREFVNQKAIWINSGQ